MPRFDTRPASRYSLIVVPCKPPVAFWEAGENPARPRHCKRGGLVEQATVSQEAGRQTRSDEAQVRRPTGKTCNLHCGSRGRSQDMTYTIRLSIFLAASAAVLPAADVRGTVLDPSGAGIPTAHISAVGRVGVIAQTVTDLTGAFTLRLADPAGVRVVVTAPGFETKTVAPGDGSLTVHLSIAA